MSLRTLEYGAAESLIGITRNALMSFVSVTTTGLALGILGAFALVLLGLNNCAVTMLDKLEFAVFLDTGISEADIAELSSRIEGLPHVASVQLVPAAAGWEKVKQNLAGEVDLSGVEGNPIPDSFRVRVDDPRHTPATANLIDNMPHVDEVIEAQPIRKHIVAFADAVKLIGGASALLLFLVMAFIISNTIRLTVYARRREIKIMQLVGATNWFIRLPLVLEGMILGAIGGGIACFLVLGGSRYVTQVATQIMPLLRQFSSEVDPVQFFGALVALGCAMGMVGSLISIRRFLKA